MKVSAMFAVGLEVLALGLAGEVRSATHSSPDVRSDAANLSATRQRLAHSSAAIQAVYEATRKPGQIQRRHLVLVGEALPWRSTLQPACLRQGDFELKQLPAAWPVLSDAPALRVLLADEPPAIRALAAEALATLHQPEDLPRLADLVTDPAEALMEVAAPLMHQRINPEDFIGPGPEAVTRFTWHKSSVANHAAWGLHLMLGECCPEKIDELRFNRFGVEGSEQPSKLPENARALLAPLAAGAPRDHLWYWQEYVHRALHQQDDAAERLLRTNTPGFDKLDNERRYELLAAEQRKARQAWLNGFIADMRGWPAERRAMVRLSVSNVHQGGADMAYYDNPDWLLFKGPLDLGLDKSRILELLDGVRMWPDERRDRGGRSQVVERLALGWRECFDAGDVPQLLAQFVPAKDDIWWGARAALVVALAHLMPATGTATEDPATAEGFLRQTLRQDRDVFIRIRAALELLRMSPEVHWPLLKERFFADRDNGDDLPCHILRWLMQAPAGAGPTSLLVDLASDDRCRPLWLETERIRGKAMQGGHCRHLLVEALNARAGRAVVTSEDLAVLKNSELGLPRLQLILERIRHIEKP